MQLQQRIATPLGPLTALRDDTGLLGLWFDDQKHHPGPLSAEVVRHDPLLDRVATVLENYFAGHPPTTDGIALAPSGTAFQRAVWLALRQIPSGARCTYGELASRLGRPQAARAIGAAVGRNPIAILVPCHRVVGADGSLTGYAGGLPRKAALLKLEQTS